MYASGRRVRSFFYFMRSFISHAHFSFKSPSLAFYAHDIYIYKLRYRRAYAAAVVVGGGGGHATRRWQCQ